MLRRSDDVLQSFINAPALRLSFVIFIIIIAKSILFLENFIFGIIHAIYYTILKGKSDKIKDKKIFAGGL